MPVGRWPLGVVAGFRAFEPPVHRYGRVAGRDVVSVHSGGCGRTAVNVWVRS